MTQGGAGATTDRQKYLEAAYRVFQRFALEDQRAYYQSAVTRFRKAAEQVNRYRALFALVTGIASALAGLLVAGYLTPGSFANNGECAALSAPNAMIQEEPDPVEEVQGIAPLLDARERPYYCRTLESAIVILTILAIVAPAISAAFTTLADLYQWDRLVSTFESALENLEVADAQSPLPQMTEIEYKASLRAYAEGALAVMRDETAQWGQIAQPPQQLEKFLEEERLKAERSGGSADGLVPNRRSPTPPAPDS